MPHILPVDLTQIEVVKGEQLAKRVQRHCDEFHVATFLKDTNILHGVYRSYQSGYIVESVFIGNKRVFWRLIEESGNYRLWSSKDWSDFEELWTL